MQFGFVLALWLGMDEKPSLVSRESP